MLPSPAAFGRPSSDCCTPTPLELLLPALAASRCASAVRSVDWRRRLGPWDEFLRAVDSNIARRAAVVLAEVGPMLRSTSQPLIRAVPEPLKFGDGVSSPKDHPPTLGQARPGRRPLPLDGGKSPFAGELRKDMLRLPTRRGNRGNRQEEKSPTSPPRRCFAKSGTPAPGTPFGTPSALRDKNRKARKSEGIVRSKSQFGREKTVLFLDDESSLPRARRSTRRQKTWTCTTATPATDGATEEASTPSYVSHSPKSSTSIPASPESTMSNPGFTWTKGSAIGTGSHGCVYKALDTFTGKIFAVKQGIRRKDLRHPNIVQTLGFDNASNHLYIYLEYVPGGSMSSLLQEFGPLSGELLTRSTTGVLQGLNYLHTRNPPVVHRDIKGDHLLHHYRVNPVDGARGDPTAGRLRPQGGYLELGLCGHRNGLRRAALGQRSL
eukprot:g30018.t2